MCRSRKSLGPFPIPLAMRKGYLAIGVALLLYGGYSAYSLQAALNRASQGCGEIPCTITVSWGYGWEIDAAVLLLGFFLLALAFLSKPGGDVPPTGRSPPPET